MSWTVTNDFNEFFAVQPAIDEDGHLTYTVADDRNGSSLVTVTVDRHW